MVCTNEEVWSALDENDGCDEPGAYFSDGEVAEVDSRRPSLTEMNSNSNVSINTHTCTYNGVHSLP